jgi:hypothetical protein
MGRKLVTADKVDEEALAGVLASQGNAIPAAVAIVLRLAAPILARMAIRFVARRLKRPVSEQSVRAGGAFIGGVVGRIITRAAAENPGGSLK